MPFSTPPFITPMLWIGSLWENGGGNVLRANNEARRYVASSKNCTLMIKKMAFGSVMHSLSSISHNVWLRSLYELVLIDGLIIALAGGSLSYEWANFLSMKSQCDHLPLPQSEGNWQVRQVVGHEGVEWARPAPTAPSWCSSGPQGGG